jgi:hypothetical protein
MEGLNTNLFLYDLLKESDDARSNGFTIDTSRLNNFVRGMDEHYISYHIDKQNNVDAYKIHIYCEDGNCLNILANSNGYFISSELRQS